MTIIVGAGLAGMLAAGAFPEARIVEAGEEGSVGHRALLRFRSDVVSRATGIPFREVTVRKGIWGDDGWEEPNIRNANRYAQKVLGGALRPRSIWSCDPVTRYVAPENFHERLLARYSRRIDWNTAMLSPGDWAAAREEGPVINTAPLPIVLNGLQRDVGLVFEREMISVLRFSIPDCDLHQTVYYPNPDYPLYRASITGDTLICEFMGTTRAKSAPTWKEEVRDSFGIGAHNLDGPTVVSQQRFGKILPVDDGRRKALLSNLTREHDIYSVGRFATWRNILLDDIVNDLAVVKRLINSTEYERGLAAL